MVPFCAEIVPNITKQPFPPLLAERRMVPEALEDHNQLTRRLQQKANQMSWQDGVPVGIQVEYNPKTFFVQFLEPTVG